MLGLLRVTGRRGATRATGRLTYNQRKWLCFLVSCIKQQTTNGWAIRSAVCQKRIAGRTWRSTPRQRHQFSGSPRRGRYALRLHAALLSDIGYSSRNRATVAVDEEMGVDIAAWLQSLGLEQYESAFRDHDIEAEVLPQLNAEDLVAIGVTSVGHRRRLLTAVAALREMPTPPPTDVPSRGDGIRPVTSPPTEASPLVQSQPSRAERRQLTVMFIDLVGSTELSQPARSGGNARRHSSLPEHGICGNHAI